MNVFWALSISYGIVFVKHTFKLSFLCTFLTVPTCQDINTKAHCYVSDPSCPTQASTDNLSNYNFTSTFAYLPQATTEEIKNLTESNVIHAATEEADKSAARVIVFIYIIVVLIAVIGIFCFLRRKKEKGKLKKKGMHYEIDFYWGWEGGVSSFVNLTCLIEN